MKSFKPYGEEQYPTGIYYITDNTENRIALNYIGLSVEYPSVGIRLTALHIDLNKKTWRTTFDYEWLYRNPPILNTIGEVHNLLLMINRNEKLDEII